MELFNLMKIATLVGEESVMPSIGLGKTGEELIEEYLEFISISIKYILLDLEATRREKKELSEMLGVDDENFNNY